MLMWDLCFTITTLVVGLTQEVIDHKSPGMQYLLHKLCTVAQLWHFVLHLTPDSCGTLCYIDSFLTPNHCGTLCYIDSFVTPNRPPQVKSCAQTY